MSTFSEIRFEHLTNPHQYRSMIPLPSHSLIFGPMEGYTDSILRQTILECFPQWDLHFTAFLRIPANQTYKPHHIIEHYGTQLFANENLKNKNILQILCPVHGMLEDNAQVISDTGFHWLDFNLGCPSKTVNGHKGGSYLLQDLDLLDQILRRLRKSFAGTLTCKIRTGYNDTQDFDSIIKILADAGIDGITIHARTRAQQYNGSADWSFIKRAVELVDIPIIGNGDIDNEMDAIRMLETTGCHAVMAARGGLKTPWLAQRFYQVLRGEPLRHALEERTEYIPKYFSTFVKNYATVKPTANVSLKRLKSISRFIFDDYPNGHERKTELFRSESLEEFYSLFAQHYPSI